MTVKLLRIGCWKAPKKQNQTPKSQLGRLSFPTVLTLIISKRILTNGNRRRPCGGDFARCLCCTWPKIKAVDLGPFVWLESRSKNGNLNDLICAFLVCSRLAKLRTHGVKLVATITLKSVAMATVLAMAQRQGGPLKAINLFNQYLNEACTPPDVFTRGKTTAKSARLGFTI